MITNPFTHQVLNANPKGCNQYSGPECSGEEVRFSKSSIGEDVPESTRHSMKDLENIIGQKGSVKLYHGTPKHLARKILKEGFKMEESGEEAARKVAKAYNIPWTEWKYRVEEDSIGAGYGTETSRVSTAPSDIASRWAKTFPSGEVNSELDFLARMYLGRKEAVKKGEDPDEWEENLQGATTYDWAESSGIKGAIERSDEGRVIESEVDTRAIPRGSRTLAKMLMKQVERGDLSEEMALEYWNKEYKDIKIHPSNLKKIRVVTNINPFTRVLEHAYTRS